MSIRRLFLLSLLTGTTWPAQSRIRPGGVRASPNRVALDECGDRYRASLEHSSTSSANIGVVDSISAEDIGKLPDQNVRIAAARTRVSDRSRSGRGSVHHGSRFGRNSILSS